MQFKWLTAALVVASMHAQSESARPRVGLVLGGGAALGLAHVGVLQWMEENRIPVDVVAGTSMGGLVAGLYATGHTSAEIREFVAQIDWDDALQLGPSFQQSSFRRKEDREQFPNQLEFGLKRGLHLPAGLSAGHGVGIVLSRFTAAYGDVEDFDQLPIPFACVAVDLISGRKVVHRRGRLFDALRSTMAIPGLFTPWRVEDMVLVDGGTLDNLPVDVARNMGADTVIAVVLETPPIESKAVESMLGVAGRSISVMIANNEKASMAQADVLVAPQLQGFRSTDYKRAEELREIGYRAAQNSPALRKLALSEEQWARHAALRQARRRSRPEEWTLALAGAGSRSDQILAANLNRALAGSVDQAKLEWALAGVPGLGSYDSADYRFTSRGESTALELTVRPKMYGRRVLQLLPQFEAASGQGSFFGLGGRLKLLDVGGPGSEVRLDLIGGAGNNGVAGEYYWRVPGRRIFLLPRVEVTDDMIPFWKSDHLLGDLSVKQKAFEAAGGWAIDRSSQLQFGIRFADTKVHLASGTLPVPDSEGRSSSLHLHYKYLGQDSPFVPRRGVRIATDFQWVFDPPGGVKPYGVLDGRLSWAKPLSTRLSILTTASGGVSPTRAGAESLFTLGGTGRLSSLARNQLFGEQYFLTQAGLLREIGASSFARLYAATFYEAGTAYLRGFESPVYHSGSAGIVGETMLGVVYFGTAVGDKGEHKVFFRLGRMF